MSNRFSADRYVVRLRRHADLSQRELAARLGVAPSVIARIETGQVAPSADLLSRILAIAGLRLVVIDSAGELVDPVAEDLARDNAGRRYPAHLDVHPVESASADYQWRPRHERQAPKAWFQLRPERDRCRAGLPSVPDQPTVSDLAEYRRLVLQQRAERLRAQAAVWAASQPPEPPCSCDLECMESGPCRPTCLCQCEPEAEDPSVGAAARTG